jgi:prevent-host-death family protein
MRQVPIAAFKDRVSEFIAEAQTGKEVIITRHGKPAAKLVPITPSAEEQKKAKTIAIDRLAEIRAELRERRMTATIDEMIGWKNEGRT